MQLALTPEVLFPLGACAVVAVAVIVVFVVFARGKRALSDEALAPTSADWTGEAATADPGPAAPAVTVPPLPQRLTVAEAVAVRDADTAPLPVSSASFLTARPIPAVPVPAVPPVATVPDSAVPDDAAEPTAAAVLAAPLPDAAAVPEAAAPPAPAEPEPAQAGGDIAQAGTPDTGPVTVPAPEEPTGEVGSSGTGPAATEPGNAGSPEAAVLVADEPRAHGPVLPPPPARLVLRAVPTVSGSSPAMSAAVALVLAARAAVGRDAASREAGGRDASAPSAGLPVVPNRTADARDRLLAVLLADPVRAVAAAEELATCRGQLGEVLDRLVASGLSTEQLSRLSGFSVAQVTTLLQQQGAIH